MNYEFLRHRENICKWFSALGVIREWVYIKMKASANFRAKTTVWIDSLNEWIDSDH